MNVGNNSPQKAQTSEEEIREEGKISNNLEQHESEDDEVSTPTNEEWKQMM